MNADATLELQTALQLLAPRAVDRRKPGDYLVRPSDLDRPPVLEVDAGLFLVDSQAHAVAQRVCSAGGLPLDLVERVRVWGDYAIATLVRFNRQLQRLERGELRIAGAFLQ